MLTLHPGFVLRCDIDNTVWQIALYLRFRLHVRIRHSDSLTDFCSDKCHKCSENVRCLTVISGSAIVLRKRAQYQISTHPPLLLQFPAKVGSLLQKAPTQLPRADSQYDARLVYSCTKNDAGLSTLTHCA